MDTVDLIFASLNDERITPASTIVCLYTGHGLPPSCSAMLRSPQPQIGQLLDISFSAHVMSAIALNAAVHDGAIMLGRQDASSSYRISGWSYRLFPVDGGNQLANRGSAFNSCLSMSTVAGVDRLYLINREGLYRFGNGSVIQLATRSTPTNPHYG